MLFSARVPLPQWVLEEMEKDPDLAYSDRFGRRSLEYISLGCDVLPILHGRSPLQAYTDFMRHFRETFKAFLGTTITVRCLVSCFYAVFYIMIPRKDLLD